MCVVDRPTSDVIARLPLFQRVGPDDRQRVAAGSQLRTFARGEEIFTEGEAPETFVIVLEGRAKIYKHLPNGKEIIVQVFGVGDLLGAVAVYEGRAYPASAQAMDATTCLLIPRPLFFSLLEQSPSMLRGVLSGLTIRLIELTDRLAELSGPHVDARFARLFLKLADQFGGPERGGTFIPFPLARQELADMTGTTIETCIRIMSRWSKEQILLTERDGFFLADRGALASLAGS